MSGKLINQQLSTKIKRPAGKTAAQCASEQFPWCSFRYMTTNKDHNLGYLNRLGARERAQTLHALCGRLEEMTQRKWVYWLQNRKTAGLETIDFGQLTFSPSETKPTKDTTMYVFRFDTYQGGGKGRIIGFKEDPCATLQIIGYDFDFSAYGHGS
jgi:hypothetical protein